MIRKLQENQAEDMGSCITLSNMNMINDFRKLWSDLSVWTSRCIVSIGFGTDDLAANSARLNRVPDEFNIKLNIFFGSVSSTEFINLLAIHIVYMLNLAQALIDQDKVAADTGIRDLYRNAEAISESLASMNPYWNRVQWFNLFYIYISMSIEYMIFQNAKDYYRANNVEDVISIHVLLMADYMSTGIMQSLIVEPQQI